MKFIFLMWTNAISEIKNNLKLSVMLLLMQEGSQKLWSSAKSYSEVLEAVARYQKLGQIF